MTPPDSAQAAVVPTWQVVARAGRDLLLRGAVLGALTLVTLELLFRVMYPEPPVQIIRPGSVTLRTVRGVPVWEHDDSPARRHDACVTRWPEAPRVVFIGSSITFGTGVDAEEAFPARVQAHLDAALGEGQVCIQNLAQPGATFRDKLVVLEEQLAASPPTLVVWEVWKNDLRDLTMLGDTAYSLDDLPTFPNGYPEGLLSEGPAHRWLFQHLRSYEYVTLLAAADRRVPREPSPERLGRIAQVGALTHAAGVGLVLLPAPSLDRPFREQGGSAETTLLRHVDAWATRARVSVVRLADVLRDEDHLALRLDPCCHYNAAGHARIAEGLLAHPTLGPLLRAPAGLARSAAPP